MKREIAAKPLTTKTKGDVKRLRREGFVPVSLHHKQDDPVHYQVEARPLLDFIGHYGGATVLTLQAEGGSRSAIVHQVQRDYMGRVLHVTLLETRRDELIKARIPISYHGLSDVVKRGEAVMQHLVEELEIRCLPGNLPDHITVEVGQMVGTDTLRVSDLPADARYEVLTPSDTVLASLTAPSVQTPTGEAAEGGSEADTAA